MLSKFIRQKIEERFGAVRYPRDCEPLATHIKEVCGAGLSASTLRRLFGFVKGTNEPRLYTLDLLAAYLGHKGWDQLLASFVPEDCESEPVIEKLRARQVRAGQLIRLTYEPAKVVEIKRDGLVFLVVRSNDKKLLSSDEVLFNSFELHYPLTFISVTREGRSVGRVQVGTVSGVTEIRKG